MNVINKSFLLAILLLFFANSLACAETPAEDISSLSLVKPKVRMPAPNFSLMGREGQQMELRQFSGKVVLLNFWATWCASCQEEIPAMESIWKELKEKGVMIVAIAADKNENEAREFVQKHGITFPVLYDVDGKIRNQYEVSELPTSYIIGKDGKFTAKVIGAEFWMTDRGHDFLLRELQHETVP